jgi:hypothetical protein
VLTDGLWLATGTDPVDYVRRLADAGAAAIGFGLVPDGPPPPEALVAACRRRGVTLFAVPIAVPFLAISELFVDAAIREREEPLRRVLRCNERLLAAVSGPDGAAGVLDVLHDELGADAWLSDRAGALLAWTGERPDDAVAVPGGRAGRGRRRLEVRGADGEVAAVLGLAGGATPMTVDEQTIVGQAVSALSIEVAHREALRQTHRRFAVELFDLAREAEAEAPAIARRLRGLGLEPDGGLIALMADRPDADEWLPAFERALEAAGLRAVATVRGGRLVAVAEWDARRPAAELAGALAQVLGPEAAVGVGSPVAHCALLDVSVADARRAVRLARLRQDGRRAAAHEELASHRGLLAQQDPDVLEHFARTLLQPLLEHDAARGSELFITLQAFIDSGGRWSATAEELHVHVNTLRHRLARVEELTGRRLDDADDRLDLHLALRARAAQRH